MARKRVKKHGAGIRLTIREQAVYDAMNANANRREHTAEDIARLYYGPDRKVLPKSWRTVVLRMMRSVCVKSRLVCDLPVARVSRLGVSAPAVYRIVTEREIEKSERG